MRKGLCSKMLAVALLVLLVGCGEQKQNLGNNYIEDSDFQYMNIIGDSSAYMELATEDGKEFLIQGHYLYSYGQGTGALLPVCNKADCLHDAETDKEKMTECNAYIDGVEDASCPRNHISYCNGYLYYIACENNPNWTSAENLTKQTLYRVKSDGSQKEKLTEWLESGIEEWAIHRGNFYYTQHTYVAEEEHDDALSDDIFQLRCLSLNGKKDTLLYEAKRDAIILSISDIMARGNYLYFNVVGYDTLDAEQTTEDNYLKWFIFDFMYYDLSTGAIGKFTPPEKEDGYYVNQMTIWDDQIVFLTWNFRESTIGNIYRSDLDGSNVELLMDSETVDGKFGLQSDGTYLYLNTQMGVNREITDEFLYYVYDKNMNLVDYFRPSYGELKQFTVGTDDGAYFILSDEDTLTWQLCRFDKSVIGTLNGADMPYEVVAERAYSEEDAEELTEDSVTD